MSSSSNPVDVSAALQTRASARTLDFLLQEEADVLHSSAGLDEAALHSAYTNYRHLVNRVDDVFGDAETASRWLSAPNDELGKKTPLEAARAVGYDVGVLEPLLIRLEHGVFV